MISPRQRRFEVCKIEILRVETLNSLFLTILSFFEMNEQVSSSVSRLDRISAPPDETICTILSNLPLEESARTSTLSKRWCKVWLLSPIAVSVEFIIKQSFTYSTQEKSSYASWIINTLSHTISTYPGPFHACHFVLPIWDEHHKTLKNS